MSKATHSGTCQCCGSHQKLPSGKLSKHGYTVENGWFNGVCMGAGHEPIEVSKSLLPRIIAAIQSYIDNRVALMADAKAGKTVKIVYSIDRVKGEPRYGKQRIERWVDPSELILDAEGIVHYDGVALIKYYSRVKSIEEYVAKQNEYAIRSLQNDIDHHEDLRDEKIEQEANWEPHPERLVQVAGQSNGPVVHLQGERYGLVTKSCAASRMGARGNFHLTENHSEVTCKACLKKMAAK